MNIQSLQRSPVESALVRQFDKQNATPSRRAAFERFQALGLPSRRIESWHYTDLRASMTEVPPPAAAPDRATLEAAEALLAKRSRVGLGRIVFVNGHHVGALSDKLPVRVAASKDEPLPARADDAMLALNQAMTAETYRLTIPVATEIDGTIEIVHVAVLDGPSALYSRVTIAAEAKTRLSVLETFVGGLPNMQRNAATLLTLGDETRIKHLVSVEDDVGLHIESLVGRLGAGAELNDFALVAGGALTRRQLFLALTGEDAKVSLGGLSLIDGARRADTTLQVTHAAPRGTSREFYRSIVDNDGVGIFQGKIIVEKPAQKTDGAMKSQAVLLSPSAQMNAKPELEIFADDVVCGHGATIAALDPEQLFYLQARGIPRREGETILLEAFGEEAIARVEDETLVELLRAGFQKWLHTRRGAEAESRS